MRTRVRAVGMVLAVLCAGVAGCQKFNHEKTLTVAPGEVHSTFADAAKGEQKVTVEVTTHGVPVNVYVVLEENEDVVKQKLLAGARPDPSKLLASKEKADSEKLEVTVPAGKSVGVVLSGAAKSTQVKLKMTGQ